MYILFGDQLKENPASISEFVLSSICRVPVVVSGSRYCAEGDGPRVETLERLMQTTPSP